MRASLLVHIRLASGLCARPRPSCLPTALGTPWGYRSRTQATRHSSMAAPTAAASPAAKPPAAPPALPPPLLSVAPMMEWTDVFFRQVVRLMSRHTWLYTEMVVDKTLIHNPNSDKFLWFPPEQRPIVCQLGGSDPGELAQAAVIVARYGYDEINLNCGCPSSRVAGKGCFGAALMMEPQLVADSCAAMAAALREAGADIPITVKCRLGVDDADTYGELCEFVRVVSEGAPVTHFVVHCRKAILGLDPGANRSIPPLRRGWAFALRRDFPHLRFSVNGQVASTGEALQTLAAEPAGGVRAEGVMIGRAAWKKPWDTLGDADRTVFGAAANPAASRRQVLQQYALFADGQLGRWGRRSDGTPVPGVRALVSPVAQLFFGEAGCGKWKREVDSALRRKDCPVTSVAQLLQDTLHAVPASVLDAPPKPIAPISDPLEVEMPEPCAGEHAGPVLQAVPGRRKPKLVDHARPAAEEAGSAASHAQSHPQQLPAEQPQATTARTASAAEAGSSAAPAGHSGNSSRREQPPALEGEQQDVPRADGEAALAQPPTQEDNLYSGSPLPPPPQQQQQQHAVLEQVVHSDWPAGQHEASGAAPGRAIAAGG